MRFISTIDDELIVEHDDKWVSFRGDCDVDCDGSGGNLWGDKYYNPETSLKYNGKSLNAEKVPFAVVPPKIITGVKGIVLGCLIQVVNIQNHKWIDMVVGDIGPYFKVGEVSVEGARRLGIPESPVSGGTKDHIIFYRLKPGKAAKIDGIQYKLQPYH